MGRRGATGRKIDGILLLDKRAGITSNAALQEAKALLRARKAGHTGSLDPCATGLLPVCLGEATKISTFLLNTDKCYRVRIRLGITTSTGDSEGEIRRSSPVPPLTREQIDAVLARFTGEITQIPPMYSALKHQGQRLYRLARQGIEVERMPRQVMIETLTLLDAAANWLEVEVSCSKGTYIRTLAEDIGCALGPGGHVEGLRRTRVGPFDVSRAWSIEQLQAASDEQRLGCLLPADHAFEKWPSLVLSDELVFFVRQGQAVVLPTPVGAAWVRLYTKRGSFLGIGEVLTGGKVAPRRLFKQGGATNVRLPV